MTENYSATVIWEKFKPFFAEDSKIDPENEASSQINNILQNRLGMCRFRLTILGCQTFQN